MMKKLSHIVFIAVTLGFFAFISADSAMAQNREWRRDRREARQEYRQDVRRARREYREEVREARQDRRRYNRNNGWYNNRRNGYYRNTPRYYYYRGRLYRRY